MNNASRFRYVTRKRWFRPPLVVLQIRLTKPVVASGQGWRDATPDDLLPQPEAIT